MIHIYNWKTNHSAEDAIMTGPRFTVNAKILDNVMGITRFLTRENVHRNGGVELSHIKVLKGKMYSFGAVNLCNLTVDF